MENNSLANQNWGSFTFTAEIQIPVGLASAVNCVFCWQNEANHYCFQVQSHEQTARLIRVENGQLVEMAQGDVRVRCGYWYTVKVEADAASIRCYVDNLLVCCASDSAGRKGRIGFHPDTQPKFRNVQLTPHVRKLPLTRDQRISLWYRHARVGLFIHWGLNTGNFDWKIGATTPPPCTTSADLEEVTRQEGWSAQKWVQTAKEIGAQYIILATFHSTCGYLRIWPSAIPGTPSTTRDYLQEILDAAEAAGIRILIYITGGPIWAINHYNKFPGVNWVDPQVYQEYKGNRSIDIAVQEQFKQYYVRDVIDELMTNYPKIAGFWYDGWECDPLEEKLFEHVHRRMPEALNIKNNYTNVYAEGEDVMSLEDWRGAYNYAKSPESHYGVDYHYNLPYSTSVAPFDREATFKTIGGWRYGDYKPELSDHPDDIKRLVAIVANSWAAVPGYGPKISGDLPEPLHQFHARLASFMSWAKESICGTIGGGLGHGGFAPGYWNDGFFGFTTLIPETNTHYLHVIEAPAEDHTLRISDCGYNVVAAVDLKTKRPVRFHQEDGFVHIDFVATHESDTVIKLETDGTERVIPASDLEMTRVESDELTLPANVLLELPSAISVSGLRLFQEETSAIPASNRMKDFEVYTLDESGAWALRRRGSLHNQRGMQVIHFDPPFVQTKKILLKVINNHNGTDILALSSVDVILTRRGNDGRG